MRVRDQAKTRLSRVMRRASPDIQAAYEQGRISLRRADILLRLPLQEGTRQLASILERQNTIFTRSRVAVAVIQAHLASGRRDLNALRADLRRALGRDR
jgi:hypothetical protein